VKAGAILLFLFFGFSWGVEVQEDKIMENLERLKKEGIISEERFKEIEEYKEKLRGIREKTWEKVKGWKIEQRDGKLIVERNKGKEKKERERPYTVYIFISSSVPLEVWWNYAHYLINKNIRGIFVLRGCIGGCKYIRPTLELIKRFLTEDGKNEMGLPVEVQIDPLKFRNYGVKVVPCVALAEKNELSCGDWSMEYHLERLIN